MSEVVPTVNGVKILKNVGKFNPKGTERVGIIKGTGETWNAVADERVRMIFGRRVP